METWPLLFLLGLEFYSEKIVDKNGFKKWPVDKNKWPESCFVMKLSVNFVKKVVILVKNLAIWSLLKKSGQKSVQ